VRAVESLGAASRGSWEEDTMNIRWMAVLTGFLVHILLIFLISFFAPPTVSAGPDPARPADLILIGLGILTTGIGGYIAGRMAQAQRPLHGLLVGVVSILAIQLQLLAGGPSLTRIDVITLALGCLAGAVGGLLSRFPATRRARW
jgi:putative membrane protein (TIGR04086 family)